MTSRHRLRHRRPAAARRRPCAAARARCWRSGRPRPPSGVPGAGPPWPRLGARRRRRANKRSAQAAVRTAVVGQPPRSYVIPATSHFSFPNRSTLERLAIRNRVLATIQSIWGGPHDSHRHPDAPQRHASGSPRGPSRTWAVARALVAARNRGVSVQVVAAARPPTRTAGRGSGCASASAPTSTGPATRSPARCRASPAQCRGACRGAGGTPAREVLPVRQRRRPARPQRRGEDLDEPHRRWPTPASGTRRRCCARRRIYADYLRHLPAGAARSPGGRGPTTSTPPAT